MSDKTQAQTHVLTTVTQAEAPKQENLANFSFPFSCVYSCILHVWTRTTQMQTHGEQIILPCLHG